MHTISGSQERNYIPFLYTSAPLDFEGYFSICYVIGSFPLLYLTNKKGFICYAAYETSNFMQEAAWNAIVHVLAKRHRLLFLWTMSSGAASHTTSGTSCSVENPCRISHSTIATFQIYSPSAFQIFNSNSLISECLTRFLSTYPETLGHKTISRFYVLFSLRGYGYFRRYISIKTLTPSTVSQNAQQSWSVQNTAG